MQWQPLNGILTRYENYCNKNFYNQPGMKKLLLILALVLLLLTGINAIIAGLLFIIEPSGAKMGMPVSYLRHSPFRSFLIPGIVLFVVNGLMNLYAAVVLLKKKSNAFVLVAMQGVLLCGWILVQVIMVQDLSPLHIIMFCIGILVIVCGAILQRKSTAVHQGEG
jgi:hypothetical protein